MLARELSHEFHQNFNPFEGHCVIDGGSHPANGTVSFQLNQTVHLGLLEKFLIRLVS